MPFSELVRRALILISPLSPLAKKIAGHIQHLVIRKLLLDIRYFYQINSFGKLSIDFEAWHFLPTDSFTPDHPIVQM